MDKHIIVLIASVKHPKFDLTFLKAFSYIVTPDDKLHQKRDEFLAQVTANGYRLVNILVYTIPREQLEAIRK